jgi:hypothetical protein
MGAPESTARRSAVLVCYFFGRCSACTVRFAAESPAPRSREAAQCECGGSGLGSRGAEGGGGGGAEQLREQGDQNRKLWALQALQSAGPGLVFFCAAGLVLINTNNI